jgi:hypothetical protein
MEFIAVMEMVRNHIANGDLIDIGDNLSVRNAGQVYLYKNKTSYQFKLADWKGSSPCPLWVISGKPFRVKIQRRPLLLQ